MTRRREQSRPRPRRCSGLSPVWIPASALHPSAQTCIPAVCHSSFPGAGGGEPPNPYRNAEGGSCPSESPLWFIQADPMGPRAEAGRRGRRAFTSPRGWRAGGCRPAGEAEAPRAPLLALPGRCVSAAARGQGWDRLRAEPRSAERGRGRRGRPAPPRYACCVWAGPSPR